MVKIRVKPLYIKPFGALMDVDAKEINRDAKVGDQRTRTQQLGSFGYKTRGLLMSTFSHLHKGNQVKPWSNCGVQLGEVHHSPQKKQKLHLDALCVVNLLKACAGFGAVLLTHPLSGWGRQLTLLVKAWPNSFVGWVRLGRPILA